MWFAAIAWLSSACRPRPEVAQFQHVADDGDAAALRPDLGLAEQRDGGRHRGRVGVVALVDQQRLAVRQAERDAGAAADRGFEPAERQRGDGEIGAGERDGRQHGERVHDDVPAGRAEPVGDRRAEDHGLDGRGVRQQRMAHQPRVGLAVGAEGDDAADAGRLGGGGEALVLAHCRG